MDKSYITIKDLSKKFNENKIIDVIENYIKNEKNK